jgi:spermidine synthase
LVASILFPIFLVPRLGLVRTSLLFGMLNAGVALWGTWILRPLIQRGIPALRWRSVAIIILLFAGAIKADRLTTLAEDGMFADEIIYARTTPYQRIVITRGRAGFQLFLNGNLQFSSTDEYRYHEALVHPAMMLSENPRRVLVLGGGDGLALREILKHSSVESITLVDLDPDMTALSKRFPLLAELNRHSFENPKVHVVNQDAMIWLEKEKGFFDAAIVDFPDPNNFALGKLYTTRFYRLLKEHLSPNAAVSVQSTSPLFARNSYWCILKTIEAAGFAVKPYYTAVPSFGVWGFTLARVTPFDVPQHAPEGLRFLDDGGMQAMFVLSADLGEVPVEINRLDNQVLVRYYEAEWKRYE